jgi:hypothetical protein
VYNPAQISHAYAFDQVTLADGSTGDGTGQTIAIVDAYNAPNIVQDLHVFDQQWGLPDPNLTVATPQGLPAYNSGWALESTLDVEWAHAMAPGANIVLVEALTSSYGYMLPAVDYAATQTGAAVVSMSWGSGEFSAETSSFYDGHFAGYTNLAFVAASGDSGAPPIWPSVSPNVVSVGGTSLFLDGQGNIINETGWSGSGGGISRFESQPAYQNGVVTQSSTNRTSPDVAYNANPNTGVYVRFNNGWYQVGGTSAGAPQWAALLAIADQGRAVVGSNPLGSQDTLNALYSLYNSPDFNDITVGTSTGNPHYSAGVGYDLVTGMGSPNANLLINDLTNWVGGGGGAPPPGSGMHSNPSAAHGGPLPSRVVPRLPPAHVSSPGPLHGPTDGADLPVFIANTLPTGIPKPPANWIGVSAAAGRTVLPADAASFLPTPAGPVYGGAGMRMGRLVPSSSVTEEGEVNADDGQPSGATRHGVPPVLERGASRREVRSAAPAAPAGPQSLSIAWRRACDAAFIDSLSTSASADPSTSVQLPSSGEDTSAVAAAVLLAAAVSGLWLGRGEEADRRGRRFGGEFAASRPA